LVAVAVVLADILVMVLVVEVPLHMEMIFRLYRDLHTIYKLVAVVNQDFIWKVIQVLPVMEQMVEILGLWTLLPYLLVAELEE